MQRRARRLPTGTLSTAGVMTALSTVELLDELTRLADERGVRLRVWHRGPTVVWLRVSGRRIREEGRTTQAALNRALRAAQRVIR